MNEKLARLAAAQQAEWDLRVALADKADADAFNASLLVVKGDLSSPSLPRHGGPADRGSADRYYGRPREPHYYLGGTAMSPLVGKDRMTDQEIAEYNAAYDAETDRKDWG